MIWGLMAIALGGVVRVRITGVPQKPGIPFASATRDKDNCTVRPPNSLRSTG